MPCQLFLAKEEDTPAGSGGTVQSRSKAKGSSVGSPLQNTLAGILEESEALSNYTSPRELEDRSQQAYRKSIWQTLQDVTRLKVCILNSWKLESAWSGLMLDLQKGDT